MAILSGLLDFYTDWILLHLYHIQPFAGVRVNQNSASTSTIHEKETKYLKQNSLL